MVQGVGDIASAVVPAVSQGRGAGDEDGGHLGPPERCVVAAVEIHQQGVHPPSEPLPGSVPPAIEQAEQVELLVGGGRDQILEEAFAVASVNGGQEVTPTLPRADGSCE